MKNEILASQAAGGNSTFYVNLTTGTNGLVFVFFRVAGGGAGSDFIYGSSWGVPVGTNPTNLINEITNEMSKNNPFVLKKVRLTFSYSASPFNLPREQIEIRVLGPLKLNGDILAHRMLPITNVINDEDEQALIYEFDMNVVIDGHTSLQIFYGGTAYANDTGCVATFYTEAIHDVYEMETV